METEIEGAGAVPPEEAELNGWTLADLDFPTFRITLLAKVMDRLTIRELAGMTDLAYAEWRVMSRLALSEDGLTVGQIAELAWVDRAEVSRSATALEARGMIARRENPGDRRTPILSLTALGRDAYTPIQDRRRRFHAALLEDLSAAEQTELDRLLHKIGARVQALARERTAPDPADPESGRAGAPKPGLSRT